MKKLVFSVAAIMLIGLLPVAACQTDEIETRIPILVNDMGILQAEQEAPDDIMPVPGGGPAYRANVHQQGVENPWPPIEVSEAFLGSGSDEAHIYYRSHIETTAGETRNNVIKAIIPGKDLNSLTLYADDVPQGIILTDGMQWSGPSAGASVLVVEIAPDMTLGEYALKIGLEINGKDYGTIPCTIEVVTEPYVGNHGITTTKIEPKPGESGISVSGLMIRLTLEDLVEKSDAVVIGKVVDIFPSRQVDEEQKNIITDVVIEVERYLYGQSQSPYIVVMVRGGRVGEVEMWVEDEPVFTLDEEVVLFLYQMESDVAPPDGFDPAGYFRVTGAMQGKLSFRGGNTINLEGKSVIISEIEEKIALLRGKE